MDFVQFLGFLITAAAMLFIFIRRVFDEVKRRKNPELYEAQKRKQEETLRNFLKSLEVDMEENETYKPPPPKIEPPPPPPKLAQPSIKQAPQRIVKDEYQFKDRFDQYKPETAIGKRQFKTDIDERYKDYRAEQIVSADLRRAKDAYSPRIKVGPSRARLLFQNLRNKQEMVILYEILNRPKGQ